MEPFFAPVTGEFPTQRPVTRSFDAFFDLRLNKRLSKQWRGWWFETSSRSLWRHCNEGVTHCPWMAYACDALTQTWTNHTQIRGVLAWFPEINFFICMHMMHCYDNIDHPPQWPSQWLLYQHSYIVVKTRSLTEFHRYYCVDSYGIGYQVTCYNNDILRVLTGNFTRHKERDASQITGVSIVCSSVCSSAD